MIQIDKGGDEPRLLFTEDIEVWEIEAACRVEGFRVEWAGNHRTDAIVYERRDHGVERVNVWTAVLRPAKGGE